MSGQISTRRLRNRTNGLKAETSGNENKNEHDDDVVIVNSSRRKRQRDSVLSKEDSVNTDSRDTPVMHNSPLVGQESVINSDELDISIKKAKRITKEDIFEESTSQTNAGEDYDWSSANRDKVEESLDLVEVNSMGVEESTLTEISQPLSASAARGRRERIATSEAGIIKQIYVENFMCHRKLKVDLNRNVNFIHGQNGSGKSAILAAIQICLGANARRTHRARNLKDLVRKDAASNAPSTAKVRVTLLNQENDGYKYDIYGDTITVERVISLGTGYNGYRLLDHNLKEQSKLKKDLDEMLDTLNIQVENPVAVLDQEEAKKFLTGKAEDKYNFFMKATELERVDRQYDSTLDTVIEMTEANDRMREGLRQKMDQVELLKRKYEDYLEADKLEDKLQQMTVKYAWSYFNATDTDYKKCVESMGIFKEKAAKKQDELSQAEYSLGNPGAEETIKRERMDELLVEAKKQSDLKRDLENNLQQALAPYKEAERNLQAVRREQIRSDKLLKAAKQRLQKARDQVLEQAGTSQSEEAKRTNLLKTTEDELSIAREKVNSLKQAVSSALRQYEELEPLVQDSNNKIRVLSNKLKGIDSTIKELESSSGNSIAMWGRNAAKVQKLVENALRSRIFSGPVIGPIGSYLKIVPGKEEYASVAELAIGYGTLDRYIVTNDKDRQIFQDIRKQAGCLTDCGCFQVHEHARYDIPIMENVDGIETVATVLRIDNDIVFNCLVDNARIDQTAVARDKKLSEEVLLVMDGQDYSIRDRNITNVYCLPKGDQWTVKNGSLAMFSNEKKLRQMIGVDKTVALDAARHDESQVKDELNRSRKEENRLENERAGYQKAWNLAKRAMQKNDALINELSTKIDDIKSEMETSANATIDTSEYEDDVREAEEAMEHLKEDELKYEELIRELSPKVEELRSRFDECSLRNLKVLQDIENAEKDLTNLLESKSQQQELLQKKRDKMKKYNEIMKKYQEKVDESFTERDGALLKARTLTFRMQQRERITQEHPYHEESRSPMEPSDKDLEAIEPINVDHEPNYYEVRILKLRKKLEVERDKKKLSKEDATVAYEKYIRAKEDIAAKATQVSEVEEKIAQLNNDLYERKRRWRQFRSHLTKATNMKFSELLSINQYAGELSFFHEDGTLDLGVQKNTGQSNGVSKDVKSLSGGERSYTTMCLLVALGETLETPFRILDEFDVFLDTEARKLTIKVLIHIAKRLDHRQFIFITPQDLSSVHPDPKLKILKLNPPQRYAVAGGLSQQTIEFSQTT